MGEAETAGGRRARRLMRDGLRLLARERARDAHAARHHLVSPACAEAMRATANLARARTRGLLAAGG